MVSYQQRMKPAVVAEAQEASSGPRGTPGDIQVVAHRSLLQPTMLGSPAHREGKKAHPRLCLSPPAQPARQYHRPPQPPLPGERIQVP